MFNRMRMGSGPSDPLFSLVQVLIQPTAADASGGVILDYSPNARAVTKVGAAMTTPSGGYSGYGGVTFPTDSDYITVPHPAIGANDFAAEVDAYITGATTQVLADFGNGSLGAYPYLYVFGGDLRFYVNGSNRITVTLPSGRHRVMLARASGVTRLYVDGTKIATEYADGTNYLGSVLKAGPVGQGGGALYSLRSTVGSARGYVGATIPAPTEPWPTS